MWAAQNAAGALAMMIPEIPPHQTPFQLSVHPLKTSEIPCSISISGDEMTIPSP